ncbi:MAG TPA: BrnT family toxin [Pyrinomonadaceae bacterium]|nr:BrnT family toxin [Pyrinomonadaceae bacterium]
MKISSILWLAQFVEKIERKHGVSTEEVEEVFANGPRVSRIERGDVAGEHLYRALGRTDAGRRGALVISARDASRGERKSYGKRKK